MQQLSAKNQRVFIGRGARHQARRQVAALGAKRALVLSRPGQSALALDIAAHLGHAAAGVYSRAAMHCPVEVTAHALDHLRGVDADCLVAIGGGSTVGLGKALALRTGLPQVAIPTTYAGSECTPILGQTENGVKTTLTDSDILPAVVLYDPELIAALPVKMSVVSGLNALAHAVEALYARERDADSARLATQGIEALAHGLPAVARDPHDLDARAATLKGAWACGTVLGAVGMALHHKLCHALGGSFDLPHAETHAVVLPHAAAFNEVEVAELLQPVVDVFGGDGDSDGDGAGRALWRFAGALGAPRALAGLGLKETDLARAAEVATQNPYWNPRAIARETILELLQNAWRGDEPAPPGAR